ncbi:putative kinetochore protein SPC24 [Spathaspora sp. JA1]|nr:putative kinetochore protein SPC24 [Spathaspora sp. JA1]
MATDSRGNGMLDDIINRLNVQNEKQLIESILASLDTLHKDREQQIATTVSNINELERVIQQLQRQISLLNKFNDHTFQVLKNTAEIEGINQPIEFTINDDISRVLKLSFNRLADLNISISKELTDIEQINISYASQRTTLEKSVDETIERINQIYEEGRNREIIAQDANVVKICLYRNLGVRIENPKGDTEEADTILISNQENVHMLKIDPDYNDFFISNQVWSQI